MAAARGDKAAAIEFLQLAVDAEDALAYDEPPPWFFATRETLGGALLLDGQCKAAEHAFRDDLVRHPRNGRALFGLSESLKAQGKSAEAEQVRREFQSAWQHADIQITASDL